MIVQITQLTLQLCLPVMNIFANHLEVPSKIKFLTAFMCPACVLGTMWNTSLNLNKKKNTATKILHFGMGDCDVAPDQDYNALIHDRVLIFLILIPLLYN